MRDHPLGSIPTYLQRNSTLRAKITDACGLTCTFCHNEGTPVATDNRDRAVGTFTPQGTSGRRSIYAASNGASFLPATMRADDDLRRALRALRDRAGLTELHLTGGEPTLHPELPDIIRLARAEGYRVCMTSNGERGEQVISEAAAAGLDRVNLSIFGTTPDELAAVQHPRFRNIRRAQQKIDALHATIRACEKHHVRVSANIVVLDDTHIERAHRLLDEYSPHLSVRLLNSLAHGHASLAAIDRILAAREATAEAHYVIAGASGMRTAYLLPDGRRIFVKKIRPVRLPTTCAGCRFNNATDCQEGFYGHRLYRARGGRWMVGVCIQRMDLCQPLDEFLDSDLADEANHLRDTDHAHLSTNTDVLR